MLKFLKIFFCAILTIFMVNKGQSQSIIDSSAYENARTKALFLYGFTKYLEWPNQRNFKKFKIALFDSDKLLFKELQKIAKTRDVYGVPLEVLMYSDSQNVPKCQVLYVNKKSGIDIESLNTKLQGRSVLIVGEDYPFNSCMINFLTLEGVQEFQVDEDRLKKANLSYSKELIQLSTSMEEWRDHYSEMVAKLLVEKEQTDLQRAEIKKLQKQQEIQQQEIESTQKELEKQQMYVYNQQVQLQTLIKENADQQENLNEKIAILQQKNEQIKEKEKRILEQELNVFNQKEILTRQMRQIEIQEGKINDQKNLMIENESKLSNQQTKLNFSLIILSALILFGAFILRNYRIKEKANRILEEKNTAIELQKKQIEEKNIAITASINYAKKIQDAILPSEDLLDNLLSEYFVFNQPKDIVSGDFYWAHKSLHTDNVIFAVADCTGHGVPGAFMSLIGVSLLNEIVVENRVEDSASILNQLKLGISNSLKQKGAREEAKDGMDIALCVWDKKNKKVDFSGAHNSLYLIRNNELHELKGDKQGIGFYRGKERSFEKKTIDVEENDLIYLFSDGFVDQKGGERNKKFYYQPFRELLTSISELPLREQGKALRDVFNKWKKDTQQIDDVCILGTKIT